MLSHHPAALDFWQFLTLQVHDLHISGIALRQIPFESRCR
jgi:hypothetical protein